MVAIESGCVIKFYDTFYFNIDIDKIKERSGFGVLL